MSNTAGSDPVHDVLIVGCGAIAGGYDQFGNSPDDVLTHAKAFTTHPSFRAVACIEPDEARRQEFQRYWGIGAGFPSLEALTVPFDVACLCTPTSLHTAGLAALLEMSPRLVFAEKPVTDDLVAARSLVAAYAARGVSLCVNHPRRWAPGLQKLRGEIAAGHWGELQRGVAHYTKGLLNNGSHMVDMLNFLVGTVSPVARFAAVADGRADDPTVDALVRAPGGAPVHLLAVDCNAFTIFELDLLFTMGRVTVADSSFTIIRRRAESSDRFAGYTMLGEAVAEPTGLGRAFIGAADNIHHHLTDGQLLASDGASALAAQEVCSALVGMPLTQP